MLTCFVVSEHEQVIVHLQSCLIRCFLACRHNILVDIDNGDKDFRYELSAICFVDNDCYSKLSK